MRSFLQEPEQQHPDESEPYAVQQPEIPSATVSGRQKAVTFDITVASSRLNSAFVVFAACPDISFSSHLCLLQAVGLQPNQQPQPDAVQRPEEPPEFVRFLVYLCAREISK